MGEVTGIEWCDHTFNGWLGCTKVSAACDHCYAEALMDTRWGKVKWGAGEKRVRTSENNWKQPLKWNKAARNYGVRPRVFCSSLSDVFDAEVDDQWRIDLFQLICRCPDLDWLLLTKRPQVAKKYLREAGGVPENVWLGTTVEDQKMAELRIPILLSIPARVRFLSCEPLLGYIDLAAAGAGDIDWVICGGESGSGARPMDITATRALMHWSRWNKSAFFMKQLGGSPNKRDRLEDFPADLRIREFPR